MINLFIKRNMYDIIKMFLKDMRKHWIHDWRETCLLLGSEVIHFFMLNSELMSEIDITQICMCNIMHYHIFTTKYVRSTYAIQARVSCTYQDCKPWRPYQSKNSPNPYHSLGRKSHITNYHTPRDPYHSLGRKSRITTSVLHCISGYSTAICDLVHCVNVT